MINNKVVLFNDTRIEANPGCQATVDNLILFIQNSKEVNLSTFDVGVNYKEFLDAQFNADFSTAFIYRVFNKLFPTLLRYFYRRHNTFDFNLWKKNYEKYLLEEVKSTINESSVVFINMEGTIHHNSVSGIVLLSIAQYAISKNKNVFLINGTVQGMNEKLLRLVFNNSFFVSVRESNSFEYLSNILKGGIKVHLIPDFAFKADIRSSKVFLNGEKDLDRGKPRCIYSFGVNFLNRDYDEAEEIIRLNIECIRREGYELDVLFVENKENRFLHLLDELRVNVIDSTFRKSYTSLGSLFDNYNLCLTGRYHIGVFGIMSGCKTYLLPSNSFKSQGMLKMIDMEEYYLNQEVLTQELFLKVKENKLTEFAMDSSLKNSYEAFRNAIQIGLR